MILRTATTTAKTASVTTTSEPQRLVPLAPELAPVVYTAPAPQLAPLPPQEVIQTATAPSYSPSLVPAPAPAPAPAPTPTSAPAQSPSTAPALRVVIQGGPCAKYVTAPSSSSSSSSTQAAPVVRGGRRTIELAPPPTASRTTERLVAPLGSLLPGGEIAPPGSILPDGRVVDAGGSFLRTGAQGGSATPNLDVIAPFGSLRADGSTAAVGEVLPDGRVVAPPGALLADGSIAPVGFVSPRGEQNFGISAQETAIASSRPVVMRRVNGILEPSDAYSRGVIQALQRALVSYADSQGVGLQIVIDGRLTAATVTTALAVIAEIGPPAGISEVPATDEDIARNARAYAEDIAAVLGIELDFAPSDTFVLTSTPAPAAAPPPTIFSGRNLKIGAALVGGFLLFNR